MEKGGKCDNQGKGKESRISGEYTPDEQHLMFSAPVRPNIKTRKQKREKTIEQGGKGKTYISHKHTTATITSEMRSLQERKKERNPNKSESEGKRETGGVRQRPL
jgi:hypothetical protein